MEGEGGGGGGGLNCAGPRQGILGGCFVLHCYCLAKPSFTARLAVPASQAQLFSSRGEHFSQRGAGGLTFGMVIEMRGGCEE